ncbi:MAG: alpha-amylase family glycosyl hydrolase [Rikenellaceae bacterium]
MGNIIYKVHRGGKKHPSWTDSAIIYEFNTRQFTVDGTFRAAMEHLPRLKELGVDILWMMPIFPIGNERRKGTLGSYYSIEDNTAVNDEFGTMKDFCNFVAEAHNLGMYVILDWVSNHTARDARWITEHPEWFEWDAEKNEFATPFDWSDTAKLNYQSEEMRTEMIKSMAFWLKKAKIDGFRCDMAMLVPMEFWHRATKELTKVAEGLGKELFMLAESEGPEFHDAFDATYSWEEHHLMNKIAKGEANCYTLGERLAYESSIYDESALRMHFTSNHDENSWNGSSITRMGDGAETFAALTFILSGMPLIYTGQEVGQARQLEFFDRDTIDWINLSSNKRGQAIERLYKGLCDLKHSHPALLAGEKGGDIVGIDNNVSWQMFAVKRRVGAKTVIALFNLGDSPVEARFEDKDFSGKYKEMLWKGAKSSANVELSCEQTYSFKAWEFRILYR